MNCAIFSAASKSVTSCVRLKLWMCVSSRALYTSCHTSCVNIDRTHSKAQARLRHRCAAFPSFLCFSLQHDCGGGQRGALDPFYSRHDRVYDRQINVNLVVATSHLKVCFAAQIYPWTIFFFFHFSFFFLHAIHFKFYYSLGICTRKKKRMKCTVHWCVLWWSQICWMWIIFALICVACTRAVSVKARIASTNMATKRDRERKRLVINLVFERRQKS